ncbi:hypothetical protein CW745_14380 [Psychromonas sp. psych-6C06]|uniref:protein YgfX n=1 Tax=Psychromonas sp. psych-6C06 TaxID=2058089 RepID=UPI000C326D22|nr:protein YgfX [Psychromonas sp. psych-6C06]PKF60523.1 hypothetical protein CW745_14380 [Psychromonas sp. psych-6C06]
MSSLNALKYKITVGRSFYAGVSIFLLYCAVIFLASLLVPLSLNSLFFYLTLSLIALYAAYQATSFSCSFRLSEAGHIEYSLNGSGYQGGVSPHSFYCHFFIFLIIDVKGRSLGDKSTKQVMVIYKDAVRTVDYRLLARLINIGRT